MDDIREQFKRTAKARCDCIDEVTQSPSARAAKVGARVNNTAINLENWDMICFCVLYLSSQLVVVPDLEREVKSLAFKIHEAHYFSGGEFGLYNEETIVRNTKIRVLRDEVMGNEHNTADNLKNG